MWVLIIKPHIEFIETLRKVDQGLESRRSLGFSVDEAESFL